MTEAECMNLRLLLCIADGQRLMLSILDKDNAFAKTIIEMDQNMQPFRDWLQCVSQRDFETSGAKDYADLAGTMLSDLNRQLEQSANVIHGLMEQLQKLKPKS